MELRIVDERLPGAAPVSEHSLFGPVAGACPVAAEPTALPTGAPAGWTRLRLGGEWSRLPLAEDPHAVAALPPLGDPAWQRAFVPDCFGEEAALSAHFGPVYYRRRLPGVASPRARLVFPAVDYLCDAWLGESHLGRHEGYFAPFAFELGAVPARAELTVRVQDPLEELDPTLPFLLHAKRVIKGVLKYHDSRPGGLPGLHTPGWTSREGQSRTTAGITGEPWLETTGPARLDAVFVTPLDAPAGRVHVAVVFSWLEPSDGEVVLELELTPPEGAADRAAVRVIAALGASRVDLELVVPAPRLWWPRALAELGLPALYSLRVRAHGAGVVSSERATRFGLRTARLAGEPKQLLVNERPAYVKAVNYIPVQHFARVDAAFYARDLELAAAAHLGSIGVHGHVQAPGCYDAADDAGFLVFQDFPLQWHYAAGKVNGPGFVERACAQLAEMIYLLHNHPSVVYWACHNEPTALFVPGMPPDADQDPDNQLLDEALERTARTVERHRHVHRASGIGDDLHVYDGSILGGDLFDVRKHVTWFVSEYGFWTLGDQACRWGLTGWPPDDHELTEWVKRLSFGGSTLAYVGLPERFASFDEWRFATEAYGAQLAKIHTEWFRMQRGTVNAWRWHFFADWWGWAGGGLVDRDRRPKATYRALQAAARPLLVASAQSRSAYPPGTRRELPIVVCNDRLEAREIRVRWRWRRVEEALVLGADPDAAARFHVPAPAAGHFVAMPGEPFGHVHSEAGTIAEGELLGVAEAESAVLLDAVNVRLPDEPLAACVLELEWDGDQRNELLLLAAPGSWSPGPGLHRVRPGA